MPVLGELLMPVLPDLTGFGAKASAQIGAAAGPIGVKAQGLGRSIGGGINSGLGTLKIAAIAAVGAALKGAFDAAQEAAVIGARTESVIESTGAAAWISAKEVEELASTIRDYSGLDDEVIQSGENVLLGFKSIQNAAGIGNDIFNQATVAMADFAAASGKDAAGAAQILGRALEDPINAARSLRAANIFLTDSEKEQIKTLVESGQKVEAQKLILDKFAEKYEGTAKRMGEANPFAIIRSQFGDIMERIGGVIAEIGKALIPLADIVLSVLGPAFDFLAGVLKPVVGAFNWVLENVPGIRPILGGIALVLTLALIPAMGRLVKNIFTSLIPGLGAQVVAADAATAAMGRLAIAEGAAGTGAVVAGGNVAKGGGIISRALRGLGSGIAALGIGGAIATLAAGAIGFAAGAIAGLIAKALGIGQGNWEGVDPGAIGKILGEGAAAGAPGGPNFPASPADSAFPDELADLFPEESGGAVTPTEPAGVVVPNPEDFYKGLNGPMEVHGTFEIGADGVGYLRGLADENADDDRRFTGQVSRMAALS